MHKVRAPPPPPPPNKNNNNKKLSPSLCLTLCTHLCLVPTHKAIPCPASAHWNYGLFATRFAQWVLLLHEAVAHFQGDSCWSRSCQWSFSRPHPGTGTRTASPTDSFG
eukprot:Sspe_Gene.59387::Locus_32613_Transcript_1_1_Confidence_1.000_Length_381::g.59387::m.59387